MPALVDEETFAVIQARMKINKATAIRNNRDPESSLLRGGYVRCGYCGWSMEARKMHKKSTPMTVYVCSRRKKSEYTGECQHGISVRLLDTAMWEHLKSLATRPDAIAAELERMQREDPTVADIEAVERSLTQVVRQQRNLIENLANVSGAAATLITDKINTLEEQRKQLTAEREVILGRASAWQRAQGSATCRRGAAPLPRAQTRSPIRSGGSHSTRWASRPRYGARIMSRAARSGPASPWTVRIVCTSPARSSCRR